MMLHVNDIAWTTSIVVVPEREIEECSIVDFRRAFPCLIQDSSVQPEHGSHPCSSSCRCNAASGNFALLRVSVVI